MHMPGQVPSNYIRVPQYQTGVRSGPHANTSGPPTNAYGSQVDHYGTLAANSFSHDQYGNSHGLGTSNYAPPANAYDLYAHTYSNSNYTYINTNNGANYNSRGNTYNTFPSTNSTDQQQPVQKAPLCLTLPEIKEEVIGSWEHPALTRCKKFHKYHAHEFQTFILDKLDTIVAMSDEEIFEAVERWILERLSKVRLGGTTHTRIALMYKHILEKKMTPSICREVYLVSTYRNNKNVLMCMELHLSYRYDPCYESLVQTSRHAYVPLTGLD